MSEKQRAKSGGAGKYGRNRAWCEMYKKTNRRMINKIKRLRKYVKCNPNDLRARSALKRLT